VVLLVQGVLGMQVLVRLLGVNGSLLHLFRREVHDAGFAVVEPNDCVIVGHVSILFSAMTYWDACLEFKRGREQA
jgi:hypothetical protein